MGKIIWLASYPKSGNTWMRALLTNYLSDSDEPADINKLIGGPIASARVWFDEWAGAEASTLDDATIARLRPEVYRCLARESDETLFMKVHDAWTLTDRGEPMFPPDVTAGVLYIVRNPLDLAASCANHWGIDLAEAVERLCDAAPTTNRRPRLDDQLRQRLGSWSEHVRSWLDESGVRIHVVRYEDLSRDSQSVFGEVVRFCGLDDDERELRKAVELSAFKTLKRQEAENGFREGSAPAPLPFFRRGEIGAWQEELPLELVERLIDAHTETMRRLCYSATCVRS